MSLRSENTPLVLNSSRRLKAIADDTRARILRTLGDGPASAKELSGLMGMSHGKIGHHLKVLREARFIEVVEERQVRALTERFYGLTFEELAFDYPGMSRLDFTLNQAAREAGAEQPFDPPAVLVTVRIGEDRAEEFHRKLTELAREFGDSNDPEASNVFGLTAAVFLTDTPSRGDTE